MTPHPGHYVPGGFAPPGQLTASYRTAGFNGLLGVKLAGGCGLDLCRETIRRINVPWGRSGVVWYKHLQTPGGARHLARRGVETEARAVRRERLEVGPPLFSTDVRGGMGRAGG